MSIVHILYPASLPVLAASPREPQQPCTPITLKFPYTPPNKAMLEATSFTYNPPAVSYVIFMATSQGEVREQILRGQKKSEKKPL